MKSQNNKQNRVSLLSSLTVACLLLAANVLADDSQLIETTNLSGGGVHLNIPGVGEMDGKPLVVARDRATHEVIAVAELDADGKVVRSFDEGGSATEGVLGAIATAVTNGFGFNLTNDQLFSISYILTPMQWISDNGLAVEIEPGISGGKARIRYINITGRDEPVPAAPIVSMNLTYFRKWLNLNNHAIHAENAIGIEASASLIIMKLTLGYFRSIDPNSGFNFDHISAGLGIGF